ncbi:MAG: AMP-binding protein, partial [Betaproteobacteria bacterium]|nr:AMP-binding protein [Betaproteobacteria bacterium]
MVSLQDILAGGADCHLSRIVPAWAQKRPHQVALFDQGKTWTYQQLADEQARMAALLQACGVRPGDRVMIVGENCAAQIISLFAIATLDAWVVMVNARLSAREIDTIREHCGARRTLYMAHTSAEAAAHAERHKAAALDLGEAGVIALSDLNPHCEPEPVSRCGDEQVAALI